MGPEYLSLSEVVVRWNIPWLHYLVPVVPVVVIKRRPLASPDLPHLPPFQLPWSAYLCSISVSSTVLPPISVSLQPLPYPFDLHRFHPSGADELHLAECLFWINTKERNNLLPFFSEIFNRKLLLIKKTKIIVDV